MNTKNAIASISLVIAALAVACHPTTPEQSTSSSSSSSSSSGGGSDGSGGSTGTGAPACVAPRERPADYTCRFSTDCYDVTVCSNENCVDPTTGQPCPATGCYDGTHPTGRCDYSSRKPAGEGCDQGTSWHGVCQADGSCCPADAGVASPVSTPR